MVVLQAWQSSWWALHLVSSLSATDGSSFSVTQKGHTSFVLSFFGCGSVFDAWVLK